MTRDLLLSTDVNGKKKITKTFTALFNERDIVRVTTRREKRSSRRYSWHYVLYNYDLGATIPSRLFVFLSRTLRRRVLTPSPQLHTNNARTRQRNIVYLHYIPRSRFIINIIILYDIIIPRGPGVRYTHYIIIIINVRAHVSAHAHGRPAARQFPLAHPSKAFAPIAR